MFKKVKFILKLFIFIGIIGLAYFFIFKPIYQREILKKIISRLEADSRIAQIVVTKVVEDPYTKKKNTTIKFLEYDIKGSPLPAKYFTFSGNIIQFQSLVVRFKDFYIEEGIPGKDKSIYLFMKAFFLDGKNTQEYIITPVEEIPEGYRLKEAKAILGYAQEELWRKFWQYALSSSNKENTVIKNAQIEAPGTKFVPGVIYTIKIEHDGGMRIDSSPIPEVLK